VKEIIQKIQNKLDKYPNLKTEYGDNYAIVYPADENGFKVRLDAGDTEYTVSYSGWHDHFEDPDEALNCFGFGLSDNCRLKVYLHGDSEYKWKVEYLKNRKWHKDSETGVLFFKFWQKKKIVYLQNKLVKSL